ASPRSRRPRRRRAPIPQRLPSPARLPTCCTCRARGTGGAGRTDEPTPRPAALRPRGGRFAMSRVAVLKGGRSLERQISLKSGARVEDALESLGHEPIPIDVGADLVDRLRA